MRFARRFVLGLDYKHSWALASKKLTLASAFRHRHSGIGIPASAFRHWHSGIGIPALAFRHRHSGIIGFSPVPDQKNARLPWRGLVPD
jgi:hypothetical protein